MYRNIRTVIIIERNLTCEGRIIARNEDGLDRVVSVY